MLKIPIKPNAGDSHQTSPFWFVVIVPFSYVKTADKGKIADLENGIGDVSAFSGDDAIQNDPPFLLTNQVINWQTKSSKSSPTIMASFRVAPGKYDWARITHAGDWVMLWAFDSFPDYQRELARVSEIIKGQQRGFDFVVEQRIQDSVGGGASDSGLKFLGRMNSPRRHRSVDPGTGRIEVGYNITAQGFGEFLSQMVFHPSFNDKNAVEKDSSLSALSQIGRELYLYASEHNSLGTAAWQTYIIDAFLGEGASKRARDKNDPLGDHSLFKNNRYMIPPVVLGLIGKESIAPEPVYARLLDCFMGIQAPSDDYELKSAGELTGSFPPSLAQFQNASCWQILDTFSHKPINEMFVTLRAGSDGVILPTYVIRQSPFTSQEFQRGSGILCTSFVDLPRWVIDPAMVMSEDLGASDSYRTNYTATTGVVEADDNRSSGKDIKEAKSPPVFCSADVLRNGIRIRADQTNSLVTNNNWAANYSKAPKIPDTKKNGINKFMADIHIDMHLKWSGTLTLKGVQQPICIGDNLEYDGVLYHIEDVSHMGYIETGTGRKHFTTTLLLSSGISVQSDEEGITVYPHEAIEDHSHSHGNLNFESRKDVVDTEFINDKPKTGSEH